MTLDSYFPLFGGFVNKNCVFGECWALSYFVTGPRLSLIFPFCHLTDVLAPRDLFALEQPTRSGSSQGRASSTASSGSPASPLCHPALRACPQQSPRKTRNTGNTGCRDTAGGGHVGKAEGLAESRAGWWGQQCCLFKECHWQRQV